MWIIEKSPIYIYILNVLSFDNLYFSIKRVTLKDLKKIKIQNSVYRVFLLTWCCCLSLSEIEVWFD